jgi:hypothetical protein
MKTNGEAEDDAQADRGLDEVRDVHEHDGEGRHGDLDLPEHFLELRHDEGHDRQHDGDRDRHDDAG